MAGNTMIGIVSETRDLALFLRLSLYTLLTKERVS